MIEIRSLADHHALHAPDRSQTDPGQDFREGAEDQDLRVDLVSAGAEGAGHLDQRLVCLADPHLGIKDDDEDGEQEDRGNHRRLPDPEHPHENGNQGGDGRAHEDIDPGARASFRRSSTRAISTPSVMPTTSASAIPMANERREISTALMNFSLGRMVVPATMIRESGGKMLETPSRPIEFPHEGPEQDGNTQRNPLAKQLHRVLRSAQVFLQDLPDLIHGVQVVLVAADLVRAFVAPIDVRLDDL